MMMGNIACVIDPSYKKKCMLENQKSITFCFQEKKKQFTEKQRKKCSFETSNVRNNWVLNKGGGWGKDTISFASIFFTFFMVSVEFIFLQFHANI